MQASCSTVNLTALMKLKSACCAQANHRLASFTAVAIEVLSMWLRTVLDDGKRNALKYFTLVGSTCLTLTLRTVPIWLRVAAN